MTSKKHYLALSKQDFVDLFKEWGEAKFRANQVHSWIYEKGASSPEEMTNLSKKLRDKLFLELDWYLPEITSKLDSKDGSTKLLLKNRENRSIETVILRYDGRTSLCVSSQVGCKLACDFCQTGKLGFVAHLKKEEILGQMVIANNILKEEGLKVTHVVFMGMGEPFDNYDNAVSAANTMIAEECYNLAARHVTLSTSGLVPKIKALSEESKAALAISLHAARDDLRTQMMPINRKYNLAKLKESLVEYQEKTNRKITIEYILIKDLNCSIREAKDLVKFVHGLKVKVNLIPFNSHPGAEFQRPSDTSIREFQKYLADRSIPAPVRYSKGLDVSAACGQLAAKVAQNLDAKPERKSLIQK